MSNSPNPFADADPPKSPLPAADGHASPNPYASPLTAAEIKPEAVTLWRDGKCIVAHRDSTFPRFCVQTNEPAMRAYRCQLTWSYPIDFSHRIIAFDVGLCESCIRQFRRRKLMGWVIVAISVAAGVITVRFELMGFPVAFLGGVLGIIIALRPAIRLKVKKVKQPYFWISGACEGFLERLPAAPPQ